MQLKRILAPTDFSECSRAAIAYAIFLARRFEAHVDVLHVWDLPFNIVPDWLVTPPGGPPQPISEIVRGEAALRMEQLMLELRAEFDGLRSRLEPGEAAPVIARVAADDRYDLIVIGTHGRSALSHLWAGSVAEKVVRVAVCPVLTVRTKAAGK